MFNEIETANKNIVKETRVNRWFELMNQVVHY